jgi:hypothetical protein
MLRINVGFRIYIGDEICSYDVEQAIASVHPSPFIHSDLHLGAGVEEELQHELKE